MIVSKITLFFIRFVLEIGFRVFMITHMCSSTSKYYVFHCRHSRRLFEVFCNKGVAGSSSAELLATFCDNILKKGGTEKLSDEAIEETLEKVYSTPDELFYL